MSFRETERKNAWKSKVVPGKLREDLGNTAQTIERKSKMANTRAEL